MMYSQTRLHMNTDYLLLIFYNVTFLKFLFADSRGFSELFQKAVGIYFLQIQKRKNR